MCILNKRQQFKDSTLQKGILGQSKKTPTCSCFRLRGQKGIDGLKSVSLTANFFI